jgi:Trypsin-like peptidase domain
MFRKIASSMVAAVVLMSTMAAPARAQFEKDDVYPEQVQKAGMETVVRIMADKGEDISQGSGVCVAYDREKGVALILTAAHVVKDAKSLSFEVFTAASYPNPARKYSPQAKWWLNEKDDVAVIVARMWVPRTARLANDPAAIRKGDHVFSLGCGFGAPPAAQVGKIADIHESADYIVERGAVGGRSGGPLIGRQGVIGLVSRGRNGVTLFVSLDKIHGLIKRIAASSRDER